MHAPSGNPVEVRIEVLPSFSAPKQKRTIVREVTRYCFGALNELPAAGTESRLGIHANRVSTDSRISRSTFAGIEFCDKATCMTKPRAVTRATQYDLMDVFGPAMSTIDVNGPSVQSFLTTSSAVAEMERELQYDEVFDPYPADFLKIERLSRRERSPAGSPTKHTQSPRRLKSRGSDSRCMMTSKSFLSQDSFADQPQSPDQPNAALEGTDGTGAGEVFAGALGGEHSMSTFFDFKLTSSMAVTGVVAVAPGLFACSYTSLKRPSGDSMSTAEQESCVLFWDAERPLKHVQSVPLWTGALSMSPIDKGVIGASRFLLLGLANGQLGLVAIHPSKGKVKARLAGSTALDETHAAGVTGVCILGGVKSIDRRGRTEYVEGAADKPLTEKLNVEKGAEGNLVSSRTASGSASGSAVRSPSGRAVTPSGKGHGSQAVVLASCSRDGSVCFWHLDGAAVVQALSVKDGSGSGSGSLPEPSGPPTHARVFTCTHRVKVGDGVGDLLFHMLPLGDSVSVAVMLSTEDGRVGTFSWNGVRLQGALKDVPSLGSKNYQPALLSTSPGGKLTAICRPNELFVCLTATLYESAELSSGQSNQDQQNSSLLADSSRPAERRASFFGSSSHHAETIPDKTSSLDAALRARAKASHRSLGPLILFRSRASSRGDPSTQSKDTQSSRESSNLSFQQSGFTCASFPNEYTLLAGRSDGTLAVFDCSRGLSGSQPMQTVVVRSMLESRAHGGSDEAKDGLLGVSPTSICCMGDSLLVGDARGTVHIVPVNGHLESLLADVTSGGKLQQLDAQILASFAAETEAANLMTGSQTQKLNVISPVPAVASVTSTKATASTSVDPKTSSSVESKALDGAKDTSPPEVDPNAMTLSSIEEMLAAADREYEQLFKGM